MKIKSTSQKFLLVNVIFLGIALLLTYFLFRAADPLSLPTIDDTAIVMRYITNFQKGYFYTYNIGDGPVYGISGFWHGLIAGLLSWLGLSPEMSVMSVSFLGSTLLFFTLLQIFYFISKKLIIAFALFGLFYSSTYFLPGSLFLGLETPLHLWLIATTFLFFLQKRYSWFYFFSAISIISKLDTSFIIAGLMVLNLIRARQEGNFKLVFIKMCLFFGIPIGIWIVFAYLVFGSPIPQSFLSKMLYRAKAPRINWFPFIQPLITGHGESRSMAIALICGFISLLLAITKRNLYLPSTIFTLSAIGTLGLYYIYNPGEAMFWYYPLPEFLILMAVFCLPFDCYFPKKKTFSKLLLFISLIMIGLVAYLRFPMNQSSIAQGKNYKSTYEQERFEVGKLANAIAPINNPVLWTGHGYPAYLFNGYVVDYSGLNFKGIWKTFKEAKNPTPETDNFLSSIGSSSSCAECASGMLLIRDYKPNVFMAHGVFNEKLQQKLNLRLAGSFYLIDLAGAPAYRVFTSDKKSPEINSLINLNDIKMIGGGQKKDSLSVSGKSFLIKMPSGTDFFQFGVLQSNTAFTVSALNKSGSQKISSCQIPPLKDEPNAIGVFACKLPLPKNIDQIEITSNQDSIRLFEPLATKLLNSN